MRGAPGFSKLIGIVTDDSGKHLKSYLIGFPRARWNILQLAEQPSIPWERREKWAMQLIQGVSQIHRNGFVVGGLNVYSIPVIIDCTDSMNFWSFKKKFVTGRRVGAYYPPEHHYVRDMPIRMDEAQSPCVTSKTDIFHLGLILWLLAENKPITRASPVCMRERCDTNSNRPCDLSHVEPIALPQLPESIPTYYRDIVSDCRAENPSDRPAARELLKRFPNACNIQGQPEFREPYSSDISTLREGLRMGRVTCDVCRERYFEPPIFHCNVCEIGDFDLCQTCYEGGAHCEDQNHLLVELGKIGSRIVPRKYHSCVKSSGTRDVVDL